MESGYNCSVCKPFIEWKMALPKANTICPRLQARLSPSERHISSHPLCLGTLAPVPPYPYFEHVPQYGGTFALSQHKISTSMCHTRKVGLPDGAAGNLHELFSPDAATPHHFALNTQNCAVSCLFLSRQLRCCATASATLTRIGFNIRQPFPFMLKRPSSYRDRWSRCSMGP